MRWTKPAKGKFLTTRPPSLSISLTKKYCKYSLKSCCQAHCIFMTVFRKQGNKGSRRIHYKVQKFSRLLIPSFWKRKKKKFSVLTDSMILKIPLVKYSLVPCKTTWKIINSLMKFSKSLKFTIKKSWWEFSKDKN